MERDRFDALAEKIRSLVSQNGKMKDEAEKNSKEMEFLRTENNRADKIIRENESLNEQKKAAREKLEGLLGKFGKLGV
jgi:FtsZ-binding cell division protein ZapB